MDWFILLFALFPLAMALWPGPVCCCGCEECSSPVDYWEVEFGTIVDQVESDCDSWWNGKLFRLCLVEGEDCVWKCETAAGEIVQLTVYLDGADYKIKVEASLSNNTDETDHVWEKNYGSTKPDCANLSGEALTWTTDNNTNCATATSTCEITAKSGECNAWCGDCDNCGGAFGSTTCADGTIGSQYQVTITGLADGDCNCDAHDGTYTATLNSGGSNLCSANTACAGVVNDNPGGGCGAEVNVCFLTSYVEVVVSVDTAGGTPNYTLRFRKSIDCSSDCSAFSGTDVPLHSEVNGLGGTTCTIAGPTCTITSL